MQQQDNEKDNVMSQQHLQLGYEEQMMECLMEKECKAIAELLEVSHFDYENLRL